MKKCKTLIKTTGAIMAILSVRYIHKIKLEQQQNEIDKFYDYYQLLNQWLKVKNEGKTLQTYFTENKYRNIAIYGMGELGNRLNEELKDSNITVAYGIDRDICNTASEVKEMYTAEDKLPETDVIVVTPISHFNQIEADLKKKNHMDVISLEDVIYGL